MRPKRTTVELGVERADAEYDRVEAAGEFVDFGQTAAFDQRLPRLAAVDQRRRRDQVAVGVVGAREFPREFGRIDRPDVGDAADQRHHGHRFRGAFAQVVERLTQREPPAEADLHVVGDELGNDGAERGADRRGWIGVGRRQGRDDRLADPERLGERDFKAGEIRRAARQSDPDLAERAGFGQHAHHGDAADPECLGDGALGHLLDVIHPRRAPAQSLAAAQRRALPVSGGIGFGRLAGHGGLGPFRIRWSLTPNVRAMRAVGTRKTLMNW